MRLEAEFGTKEEYEEAVSLFGEPPCTVCVVQAACKRESSEKTYSWILNEVCTPMEIWINTVRKNLLRRQLAKIREDKVYREKVTERLLEIAKKQL